MSATATEFVLSARDGYPLAATWFEGAGTGPAVLIAPAAAAPRRIYTRFAEALVAAGARAVMTFDYRGIGGSRPPRLAGFAARMTDWTFLDFDAAADELVRRAGGPIVGLGHSYGGQALGLSDMKHHFARYAAVATLNGYYRGTDEPMKVFTLMNLVARPLSHVFGYTPGKRLGLGEDMPKQVFLDWADWCLTPTYNLDVPGLDARRRYAEYDRPYLAVRPADDPWGTERALEGLLTHYVSARIERRVVSPAEVGVKEIGHFGWFRPEVGRTAWAPVIDWLLTPDAGTTGAGPLSGEPARTARAS